MSESANDTSSGREAVLFVEAQADCRGPGTGRTVYCTNSMLNVVKHQRPVANEQFATNLAVPASKASPNLQGFQAGTTPIKHIALIFKRANHLLLQNETTCVTSKFV